MNFLLAAVPEWCGRLCRGLTAFFGFMLCVLALMPMPAYADYASSCAPCHSASGTPEVNNLPNGIGLSGSIRAANNLTYLNTKIGQGMGGSTTSGLSASARQAIVTEIGNSSSVSAPVFTSASAPGGTVNSAYSHTFTANAAPTLVDNNGLATPFTLASGSLPTGVTLDGATGTISGTPSAGGFFSGSIRANNLIGAGTTQSFNISIAKLTQTVSFGAAPTPSYSAGGTFSVSASASTGFALTYSASGMCSVANANVNSITMTGAGNCFVTAMQAGTSVYNSAQASQSVTISKGNQTINFSAQSPATRAYAAGLSFALNPVATGGPLAGAITYVTNNSQICTIAGTTVTVGPLAGTCTVTATQNGNENYNTISAAQSVVINATAPTAPAITLAAPGDGQATIAFSLSASDGGSPITTYRATCNPGNVQVNGAGSPIIVTGLTNSTAYTCSVASVNAIGSTSSGTAMVTPTNGAIAPGFTSPNSATFTVGSAGTFTVAATGVPAPTLSRSGTLPQGVTFTPGTGVLAGTPPLGTAGTYPQTFTASNAVPPNAVQSFTLTIARAAQTITFGAIADQTLNSARVPLTATSSSGLAVSYTSNTPAVCTIVGTTINKAAAGTCTVTANQAGNANYLAATAAMQSFAIVASGIDSAQGGNDWANGGGFLQFNACDTCHGATPTGARLNAANSPSFINWIFTNNFAANHSPGPFPLPPNTTQQEELAAYIGTFVAGTNPVNASVLHNTSTGVPLPNITLNTGTLTSIQIVTPPTKGTIFMSGTTAIFTPFTGQSGQDSFTYRGIGPAGSTDTRTATVIIALPSVPAITSGSSAGGTTGTPFSFNLAATNAPTLYGATGLPPGLFINTSTGQIYGTPTALGVYSVAISAGNAGGTGTATLTLTIAGFALSVTKAGAGSGTVSSNPAGINCGGVCTANFNFNAAVTLSATPAMGSTLAGWSGGGCSGTGTCVVTMDSAKAVTATFNSISVPGAPVMGTVTPGSSQATITFGPPAVDGGSPITGYTATCSSAIPSSASASAANSPIVVTGLSNGVTYSCSITATNLAGTGPASSSLNVTPQPDVTLVAAQSRKTHGVAGDFDLPLDTSVAINGLVTVESRSIGAGHRIVFQFSGPVSIAGVASATDINKDPVGAATASASGSEVEVVLTGIADNSRAKISLTGVNGGTTPFEVSAGFLIGDVNSSRSVNATDISGVKARSGQVTSASNFRFDVNTSGGINATDISAVKARSGLVLP
jgi:hypothetical protein